MVARGGSAPAWRRMAGADGLALAAAAGESRQRGRATARAWRSPTSPFPNDVNSPAAVSLLISASSMQKMHCAHVLCPYAPLFDQAAAVTGGGGQMLIGRVEQGRRQPAERPVIAHTGQQPPGVALGLHQQSRAIGIDSRGGKRVGANSLRIAQRTYHSVSAMTQA